MFKLLKIFKDHGYQAIPDLEAVQLPSVFRGLPVLNAQNLDLELYAETMRICPTAALNSTSFDGDDASNSQLTIRLDMGRCLFCGECAMRHPANICFTSEHRTARLHRQELIISSSEMPHSMPSCQSSFSESDYQARLAMIRSTFSKSLKLRQLSAGGDASCEMELNATGNVNFDFSRDGVEFVASPRHADGLVITGPMTVNMAREAENVLASMPRPIVIIAVGTDAISGGLFASSPAIDRSFFARHHIDLYVPGNPAHPLTFINGIHTLISPR